MNHVRKSKLMYPKQWEEKHGVWDEKSRTYILPSGTVKQGRRPMFKPYKAIQVCNAGDWPTVEDQQRYWKERDEHLDRTESNALWFDNKAKTERSPFA